mmetsp:Transcript_8984/g.17524  ORF Transcript_8984/g.17524 Transcript_8984/m.17524 type:complete len:101 (+) Transcript_8984:537-839(+)
MKQIMSIKPEAEVFLVANKCDRTDYRVISTREGKSLATKHGIAYMECSAKSGDGVVEAYRQVTAVTTKSVISRRTEDAKRRNITALHGGKSRKCPGCVLL